jgi:hypothetical protein
MVLNVWIREALQEILDSWNSLFDVAEEMGIDFCFYISPFLSVTARHLHAAALPLKRFFYGPLRGRRTIRSSRYRSLKVGASKMPLQPKRRMDTTGAKPC